MEKVWRYEWNVEQIRSWISAGKTHAWIGEQLGRNPKLIYKVCKKHRIECQRRGPRSGPGHPDWKGGVHVNTQGYRMIYTPGHPHAKKPVPYVFEHRLVMEKKLGRYLLPGEVVHHKNGVNDDNRIENLELFSNNGDHLRHELTGKCPRWSEDGKRRIREAIRGRHRQKRDSLQPQSPEDASSR